MDKEPVSVNDIKDAILKVFTRDEISQMGQPQLNTLWHLIAKRLNANKPSPTLAELEGIRELVTIHLWHSAFDRA